MSMPRKMKRLTWHLPSPVTAGLQAWRALRGERRLVVIATAHKVGSTWLYGMLVDLCRYMPYSMPADLARRQAEVSPVDVDLEKLLADMDPPFGACVFKSHSYPPDPAKVDLPAWIQWITMIRDPRDIIVSSCFYLAGLPEDQGGWGDGFSKLSEKQRILRLLEEGDFIRLRLRTWANCSYAHPVRYEALLSEPVEELGRLLAFLGVEATKDRVEQTCQRHSFQRQTGRQSGEEDRAEFQRKGIAGDWHNHFDDELVQAFKQAAQGDWNELLVELGYESSPDW